ncbi:hypothetical protein BDV32DRAFT_148545 [Aspergillus pseudonomiae]|uniref:Uncharacterized protein n=1 Tax=Aspergillus pseudonomiae TaxID=1506151 RepID=A0A5N7DU84_9EURO|nr:uncharacterized protein BDV37DRAFT_277656 [Aspergillus pseudonomiae]KAB8261278.1 hypothetical protein BDV32DRAFT_148545 [Aspergillus pseudonomiae]KAE8410012.1 hypothetical protein BDV37DRAFT_277656 [Aspergillus pseudonomiae]
MTYQGENINTGEPENIDFTFTISNPTLKFVGTRGQVELVYDLGGKYGTKDRDIPKDTKMELTVDITNLKGTVEEHGGSTGFKVHGGQLKPDEKTKETQKPNYIVQFDNASADAAQGICLVFRDAKLHITNKSTDNAVKRTVAMMETTIRQTAEDETKKLDFQYFLAGVTNQVEALSGPQGTVTTLKPKSFCFTLIPSGESTGALIIWIGVEGGHGNGSQQSGKTSLTFHPSDFDRCPIPSDSTASIIFQHDLIANQFFKPTLEQSFTDVKVTSTKSTDGIKLTGKLKDIHIKINGYKESYWEGIRLFHKKLSGVDFWASDTDSDITVDPSNAVKVSYTSLPQKNLEWVEGTSTDSGIPHGMFDLTFRLNISGSWTKGSDPKQPNILEVEFTKNNTFDVEAKGKKPGFFDWMGFQQVPDFYSKLKVNVNKDLQMGRLDYFLTTNLLFPGKHVFIADSPLVDATKNHGLMVPRDVILTGKVAESLT